MRDPEFPSQEKIGVDVSAEFMNKSEDFDFFSFANSLKSEPSLEINLDLTGVNDRNKFVALARKAKAFLEVTRPAEQTRQASIRCTVEQKSWERNVFGSGVRWEKAEGE